ncbi:MAG TPA: hypothetical protein VHE30_11080, partial [Polyangiaceae bacterium]|nr:hypothetical protein [Polyangiaceae bacterium]
LECLKKGLTCRAHCIGMLSGGDTSMADCIAADEDMLAAVQALATLAATASKHVASAARLAIEACTDCEAACRKHADKHVVCKECADSCAATIAACRLLV